MQRQSQNLDMYPCKQYWNAFLVNEWRFSRQEQAGFHVSTRLSRGVSIVAQLLQKRGPAQRREGSRYRMVSMACLSPDPCSACVLAKLGRSLC